MTKFQGRHGFLYAGILLILVGVHLRAVDTFVLNADATRVLASWSGPPPETARGTIRQFVINATSPREPISPPAWLGWALLSLGIVLTAQGLLRKSRK
jgi:hypothetical protein